MAPALTARLTASVRFCAPRIRKIAETNPDNTNASFTLGVFSIQTGQFEKAEARFTHVLDLQADNYEAMYYLAYARAQQNIPGNSRELLEQVIAGSSDSDLKQKACSQRGKRIAYLHVL